MRRAAAVLCCCFFAGCTGSKPASPRRSLDEQALAYVRLAVALGERDPDALDFYSGPEDRVAGVRRNPPRLADIRKAALALMSEMSGTPRANFLRGQLRAIAARADLLLGAREPFDREAEDLFGIRPGVPNESSLKAVRRTLAKMLPGQGQLAGRYASFEAAFFIPADRLPDVMAQALSACRRQTVQHIALPRGESVTVEYVRNKPWSAFSRYLSHGRSAIQVNTDLGLTVDRALRLACHEGYPGHHVFNTLVDLNAAGKRNEMEFSVQPAFSPQSLVSEGAATVAADIAFSDSERLRVERDSLFPAAGLRPDAVNRYLEVERLVDALHPAELAIARDFIDGRLEFVRAGEALEEQVLMPHPDAMLRYLNEYRTYAVTYTDGRDRVSRWIAASSSGDRWDRFRLLMSDPRLLFTE